MCWRWSIGGAAIFLAVFGGAVLRLADSAQADRVVVAQKPQEGLPGVNPEDAPQKGGEGPAPPASQGKGGRFQVLDASKADLRIRQPIRGILLLDTETGRLYGLLGEAADQPPLKWTLLAEGPK